MHPFSISAWMLLQPLSRLLKKAGTVVFNGPAGVFEDADFATGTYELLRAASQVEFSVVGGGHTAVVIEKLGIETGFHAYLYRWRSVYRVPYREESSLLLMHWNSQKRFSGRLFSYFFNNALTIKFDIGDLYRFDVVTVFDAHCVI
ncbi:MAG: phosphoglycerate kinase [Desulfobacterales bacterium]|nr:phosphoglycerate kinase [Desulfobacterales bacterium]